MARAPVAVLVAAFLVVLLGSARRVSGDEWPQWRGPSRDGVWRETGLIEKFAEPRLPLRWRVPIAPGYSGPTVAGRRVYVTDRVTEPASAERIHAFDADSGEPLWTHAYPCAYDRVGYPAGPRASVTVAGGRAYALGTMGHLRCLDAATGDLVWQKDPGTDYRVRVPTWGVAAAPLVEGDRVIVMLGAEGGAGVVALDTRTGREQWRALDDRASYAAPILLRQADQPVLVCWTGDAVTGLDPASGKVYWRYPFKPTRMIINCATPVVSGDRLFVSSFYDGSLLLRLGRDEPTAEKLWQRRGRNENDTDALHAMISTPLWRGEYLYGVDSYGQLRCLDARTGDRVWENLTAVPKARWSTIHMVTNGDRVWLFNERGDLIIAEFSPEGYREISRAKLLDPTKAQLGQRGGVCWSHPAYAYRHVFARNDEELVCASLAAE